MRKQSPNSASMCTRISTSRSRPRIRPPGGQLVDEFDAAFNRAIELRLRADVPVTGYLSGGIDSAMVLAVASRQRSQPISSFTIQITDPRLDETERAMAASRIGTRPTVLRCDSATLAEAYPRIIQAADCPVVDTSCARAPLLLSGEVHRQGYKVALTGEGSDEAFAATPGSNSTACFGCSIAAGLSPAPS